MTSVSLEVWQERCGIVQFCSGRDMSRSEAEDIVAAQFGLSDDERRTLRRMENEHQSWQAGGHRQTHVDEGAEDEETKVHG